MQKTAFLVAVPFVLLACGNEPSPVVVGTIERGAISQALTTASPSNTVYTPNDDFELNVEINGSPRILEIDSSNGFAVQELPTGDLRFQVEIEGITGTLDIQDVQPGEIVEIGVGAAPGQLELRVVRRDAPTVDETTPDISSNGTIEINGRHVIHHLDYGSIDGDLVINGDHVTVVGPDYYGCRRSGRTVVEGNLVVNGRHVRIVNVEIAGRTTINGDHVKVYEPCQRHRGDDD